MTNLSDIIPNLNPGQSGFNIGTEIVTHLQQSTDITLTTLDLGKTIFINATQEINLTLPDATVVGSNYHNAFGIEILGATVNLRDAAGNLIAWFDGMDVNDAYQTPEGMVGCILHLVDFSTAAGKWIPSIVDGTIYSPKIKASATASLTEMDISQMHFAYGGRHQQFKAFNPVKLDEDRTLYMWRQVGAVGQRARVIKLNRTTGVISFGSVVTLDATDNQGYHIGVLMKNNHGVSNTDIVLTYGQWDGTNYFIQAMEINDTAISTGTRVLIPDTDDNTQTVNRNIYHPALVRLSDTKAVLMGGMLNTTQNRNKPYALHITLSGDPPLTVTASTPVNLKGLADTGNFNSNHYGFFDAITGVADRVIWTNGYGFERGVVLNTAGSEPAVAYELLDADFPRDGAHQAQPYGFMDPNTTGRFIINDDRGEYIWEVILGSSAITSAQKIDYSAILNGSNGYGNTRGVGLERFPQWAHLHDDDWRRTFQVSHSDSNLVGMINDQWNRRRDINYTWTAANRVDSEGGRSPSWRDLEVPWRGNMSVAVNVLMESSRWVLLSSQDNDTAPGDDSEYHFASFEVPEF